jgi:spermidine/putrescine transport system substrate-binding protein
MTLLPKIVFTALCCIAICSELHAQSTPKELTLYIWEDYISPKVIENFTKTTGIEIQQVRFDSDKTRDGIVASERGKQFDLVLFGNVSVQIFGKNNKLTAITKSDIPNLSHIDRRWQESCGNFGVPYFYGTVGLLYDKRFYPKAPDSWKDLLEPTKEHWGHIVMVEDLVDTLAPALLYLGQNINSEKEETLKTVFALMKNQAPAVLNYQYVLTNAKAAEKGKEIHLALGYSGDQYTLNEHTGSDNWQYVIPKEGTAIWMDCLAITAWSKKQKEARDFINYLLDPKIAAKNAVDVYNATPISETKAFMSQEQAEDPQLFVPEQILQNGQEYRILSDNNMRLRGRIIDSLLKLNETK